jgi:GT2 family glycosyltransferase
MLNIGVIFHNNRELVDPWFYFIRRSVHVPYRVIAVNNGSEDDTFLKMLVNMKPCDKSIETEKNIGIAAARNIILIEAEKLGNDPICFLDSDAFIVRDGSIDRMADRLGSFGVVFGAVHSFHDWKVHETGICFSMFSPKVFETVGKFDERFFCFYDDTDMTKRAQAAGFKWTCEKSAICVHAWGSTLWRGGRCAQTKEILKADNAKFNEKWHANLRWDSER